MDSIVFFNNSVILSILKLILTYQEYRIAFIYATDLTKDITTKISELTYDHMVPVTLMYLDTTEISPRDTIEEPTLNMFVMNNLSDIHSISQVRNYLQPNDITVILFDLSNSNESQATFQPWMKLSTKVLILSKTLLISVDQFDVDQIEKISIHPYNRTTTQQFIEDYLKDIKNAKGAEMIIFMNHIPPKASVGPLLNNNNYTFNGPDGVIADILFKALNVTPTYVLM